MTSLLTYIIKRVLIAIPLTFFVLILTFIMSRLMMGDPTYFMFPLGTDPEIIEETREKLGLNEPWFIQLGIYLISIFRGDFGVSASAVPGAKVSDVIKIVFPRTIELMIFPILLIPILGVKLGKKSAVHRNKLQDGVIRVIALCGVALPSFWLAMLLQYFVGKVLPDITNYQFSFPFFGYKGIGMPDPPYVTGFRIIDSILANDHYLLMDTIRHMILPSICIILVSFASITRQTRSSMLEVMEQDYIRTARAKGIEEETVINKHMLRNALIPTSTVIVYQIAGLLAGSFLVETVFNYNGLGRMAVESIVKRDYWMINAIVIIFSLIVITGNLLIDILYSILDPRIRYK